MMNKQSGSVAKSFLKKETLLLGLITFLIYGSVYFYERGVAYALHIPFDFIIINITTISDDFISFYLYLFPLLTASSALLLWSGRHQGKKAIAHFLICGFYVLLSWLVMSKNINDVMFSIFNSGIVLYLLHKWFPFKNEEAASQSQSPIRYFGENLIDVAAFLFVFANTFVGLGRGSVVNDEYTTFLKDGNEYAIVKVYDENMFVWKVKNEMILRELTYFKLDDVSKEVFTRKILKSK